MSQPANEAEYVDQPEPAGTSAVVDDIEVFEHPDQWPTADLTGVDDDEAAALHGDGR